MSLVLDTGAMKYRESPSQPWRPLVIKAGMNWESMADTYDPDNGTYEVGQYVLEEGMMYRCIYEITTPEAWTPAHWTSANVADELASFIIISDEQPTEDSNKIWIAETTSPFGVQIPTMDDHNALGNTLTQLDTEVDTVENGLAIPQTGSTCTKTGGIPVGAFIFLQGHSTLADGIYQNTSGSIIANGATFTGSNLTRCYQETGALNLLYGRIANIANIETGTNSTSSVSVPTDTSTAVSTVSLTKGVWLLIGTIDWASNGNGYRQASFGDGTNPGREYTTCVGSAGAGKETYTQVVFLKSISTSETVTLYARQGSGSALNAYPNIYAIQLKG